MARPRLWRWVVYMFSVYILKSEKAEKYYIGYTADLHDRIKHHNSGASKFTRTYMPWRLVYKETFQNKSEAWKREQQIKSYKSGNAFKKLLEISDTGGFA